MLTFLQKLALFSPSLTLLAIVLFQTWSRPSPTRFFFSQSFFICLEAQWAVQALQGDSVLWVFVELPRNALQPALSSILWQKASCCPPLSHSKVAWSSLLCCTWIHVHLHESSHGSPFMNSHQPFSGFLTPEVFQHCREKLLGEWGVSQKQSVSFQACSGGRLSLSDDMACQCPCDCVGPCPSSLGRTSPLGLCPLRGWRCRQGNPLHVQIPEPEAMCWCPTESSGTGTGKEKAPSDQKHKEAAKFPSTKFFTSNVYSD